MTVEETELTFTRCPGCRSLVPATASRCRMCGEVLGERNNASPTPDKTTIDALEKKSRVRQRTMSVPENDMQAVKEQIEAPAAPERLAPERLLSERLEPAPEKIILPPKAEIPNSEKPTFSLNFKEPKEEKFGGFRLGERNRDAVFAGPVEQTVLETPKESPVPIREHYVSSIKPLSPPTYHERENGNSNLEDEFPLNENGEGSTSDRVHTEGQEMSRSQKRRRRRNKKRRDGGFADTPQREQVPEQVLETIPNVEVKPLREHIIERKENMITTPQLNPRPAAPVHEEERRAAKMSESPARGGALIGWFVSYKQNSQGSASEIREGRFFVCKEKLKGSDYVIDHESISTPHCLIKSSAEELRVQDLMSERGTFIKHRGEDQYQRYNESVALQHGDWLKLGDYEVLVCLIEHPQKKG